MGQACLLAVTACKYREADSLILTKRHFSKEHHSICTPPSASVRSRRLIALDLKSRKFFSSQLCITLHLPAMLYVGGRDAPITPRLASWPSICQVKGLVAFSMSA